MPQAFDGKNILIVEDDAVVAMMPSEELADMGFSAVEVAYSVAGAAEKLTRFQPHVALLDVQVTDGSTSAIARVLNMRSIPFVVMSGDRKKAGSLSPPTVPPLAKPFPPAQLSEAIAAALSGAAQANEASRAEPSWSGRPSL